ncbi:Transcription initiation factor iia small subunit [Pleurostoma richardsiae]|uniref:Transcription initiation factor iia small subunit n=1 Tax=Pleurostoma richardsiae TaxID=41990 RepID=A0AA38S1S4_9PEZI|nr:Transcription initiation factor iia small subunit [Pleurostoma richardsiae]
MLRQRRTHPPDRANAPCSASARTEDTPSALDGQEESMTSAAAAAAAADDDQQRPLLNAGDATATSEDETMSSSSWTRRNQWIVLALASGACAAFNGVFAKLTTTELTSSFSKTLAGFLHLSGAQGVFEFVVRCTFFGLNLVFNGVMWTLFTAALAKGHSTTQVSIMNTSSNFVITAVLGFAIFSEALPPLWWVGATMLVAGNVIIGSKDEGPSAEGDGLSAAETGLGEYALVPQTDGAVPDEVKDEDEDEVVDEDVAALGDLEEDEDRRS